MVVVSVYFLVLSTLSVDERVPDGEHFKMKNKEHEKQQLVE